LSEPPHAQNVTEDTTDDAGDADGTVPEVELGLYQASVTVRGRSDDDLDDVEDAAVDLMNYLAELSEDLDDSPEGIGLG